MIIIWIVFYKLDLIGGVDVFIFGFDICVWWLNEFCVIMLFYGKVVVVGLCVWVCGYEYEGYML